MQFQRARRHRGEFRLNEPDYTSELRIKTIAKLKIDRSFMGLRQCSATRSAFAPYSRFHKIRRTDFSLLATEKSLIDRYFESQEDPWMRERLAKHCLDSPKLRHITEDYLDRVAKLKLFL
jgi:hypothetical protein